MAETKAAVAQTRKNKTVVKTSAPAGGFYFLGFIGSAVYFIQHIDGFWLGVLAVLKACVWPAFLIHRIFEVLKI